MDCKRNVLITSALPYVNNVPHLGNIIGSVLSADVFARYSRLRAYNVLFVCGTDEYGTTTEVRASQENLTPKEICDKFHLLHKKIYDWFGISFDAFGRTSTDQHTEICHHVFNQLYDNHFLTQHTIDQLYCGNCSKFLADIGYLEANVLIYNALILVKGINVKNVCNNPVLSFRTSEHLFLQLPALKEELCAAVRRFFISNQEAAATTWKLIDGDDDKPLEAKCITRDLKWGVPVPLETFRNKVLYVWFDAPLGYVSITKCHTSDWEFWWKSPDSVELHQFMGKDNVPFHTVLFPSMLIGSRESWTLPTHIHATQFLLFGTDKFSKSNGIGVFGDDVEDLDIPVEVWRYYLISIRPEVSDTIFSWDDLQAKLNHDLADNVGNLINRVLTFIAKPAGKGGYGSIIPDLPDARIEEEDLNLSSKIDVYVQEHFEAMEKGKLKKGLEVAMKISQAGNQYIQGNKVWELYKENSLRCGVVVKTLAGVVGILAYLLEPFMPSFTVEVLKQLDLPIAEISLLDERGEIQKPWNIIPAGHQIGTPRPLFKKLKNEEVEALKRRFSGNQSNKGVANIAPAVTNANC